MLTSEIGQFLMAALEATTYVAPRDHGLTWDELQEVTRRAGFKPGEVTDALNHLGDVIDQYGPRFTLAVTDLHHIVDFNEPREPEYLDWRTVEFVRRELDDLAREVGHSAARLARGTLAERGVQKGYEHLAVERAVTALVISGIWREEQNLVQYVQGRETWVMPSAQVASRSGRRVRTEVRPALTRAYPVVRDVLERRGDGRSPHAEPLDSFAALLDQLGHQRFRAWWIQMSTELRRCDVATQPVSALVAAASLGEAALAFVVPRAQAKGLMKRVALDKPRTWKFADLVQGAKSSDPNVKAILDESTAQLCLRLNDTRQRIHAGYLIDMVAAGPIPDLRPEQAREAVTTSEALVRKIIEWLEANGS